MITRPQRLIVSAILLLLAASVTRAMLVLPLSLQSGPTPSAQVGIPYSSAITAANGWPPYTYAITGSLPTGLTLDSNTGDITGTPTVAGIFHFTGQVTDAAFVFADPNAGPASLDAARRRTLSQSGNHAASVSSAFTITVSGAPSAAGAPTSVWTLCMMMTGLAGVGFFHLRQKRRA